jgi:hypothetical protein
MLVSCMMHTMAATLNYSGIRITVPVEELAQAIRQLQSVKEGVEPELIITKHRVNAGADTPQFGPGESDEEMALAFLNTVAAREPVGAPVATIMACLGAAHPKGVGSKMAIVNRVLDQAGFAVPDVYTNSRDTHGERLWRAGPRLIQAITAIEASMRGDVQLFLANAPEGFQETLKNNADNKESRTAVEDRVQRSPSMY